MRLPRFVVRMFVAGIVVIVGSQMACWAENFPNKVVTHRHTCHRRRFRRAGAFDCTGAHRKPGATSDRRQSRFDISGNCGEIARRCIIRC